ncbi:MAG: exodeoxyribonuclease VII large subunit [Chlamydiota bacterium]|nr:exodeoxyribonuclease VII large subunit [Chlamydiota bacterium]
MSTPDSSEQSQDPNKPVLSVTQLTNAVKHCLESTFPLVWVQGEISNFKKQSSGHLYFSLKDSKAQISAVMFRGSAAFLKVIPKDGDKVIVQGDINVYPPSGKYQIIVRELRQVGIGELLVKLEELKVKINKKGWFKPEYKKPIPKFPKTIGVVTSPTGAAIQDILNVLSRRFSGFRLILNPVRVQGDEAAREIAQAIEQFNEHNMVDVMIVGRGGGSIEDLWAFNEEIVAEAIFKSRIPIIAAVGHETDHCIAEYVADVRAPTPSAAAEIVIAEKAQQLKNLDMIEKRLSHALAQLFRHRHQQVSGILKHPLFSSPYYLLGPWMQKFDDLRLGIDQAMLNILSQKKLLLEARRQHTHSLQPTAQINAFKQKLSYCSQSLDQLIMQKIQNRRENLKSKDVNLNHSWHKILDSRKRVFDIVQKRKMLDQSWKNYYKNRVDQLTNITSTLKAIDPKDLLSKGYSILFSEKTGSVIKSVHQLQKDEEVRLMLSDGAAISTINKVIKK